MTFSDDDLDAVPTLWRLTDDLWEQCRPLLPPKKPPGTDGRLVVPFRTVFDGILYVLRTGCPWKAAPKEFGFRLGALPPLSRVGPS